MNAESHPTTSRVHLVVEGIDEAISKGGVDATTAGILLAHHISVWREHDGNTIEIDHDPLWGPQLVLRYRKNRKNEIELTLEPERPGPRPVGEGGAVADVAAAVHAAALKVLRKIASERRWSEINPEGHNVEDLFETHRHAEAARNVLVRWLKRTRDAPRGETPPGSVALAELVATLRDAADTSLRAGWKRADDRGSPTRLELTICGRPRQATKLTRYQPATRTGRSQPVEAIADDRRGCGTVELNDIGQQQENLVRCPTMEIVEAFDEETNRKRKSRRWNDQQGWERLLRSVALNWAWRDAGEAAQGEDLCEQRSWYKW